MKNFTISEIIDASGGKFFGDLDLLSKEVSFITTDSRKAGKGGVFAAIVGERVDGHSFIPQCVEIGIICSIAERAPSDGSAHILVENTPEALRKIAKAYREKFDIPFIGISGSVGKTRPPTILPGWVRI